MADAIPDYRLEIMRIRANIAALRSNLENYRREIVEVESRTASAKMNIAATKKAIADQEQILNSLVKAHGDVKNEELD